MRFLVFLTLAGLCNSLQAPLHYKYHYEGRVLSGIPEISNQAAVVAIKADVEIYVEKNDGVAVFQLHDIKVAEYHDDIGCDFKGELDPTKFQEISEDDLRASLESPFKVDLFNHKDFALEFVEDKYNWARNVRKGVVGVFSNEVLKGNIDDQVEGTVAAAFHKKKVVNIFSVNEETMFGKCKVHYTVYPVPTHLAGTRNRKERSVMEKDVQYEESSPYTSKTSKKRSKTSKKTRGKKTSKKRPSKYRKKVPELKQDLWHVTRSVDFDHCEEKVFMQVTPILFNDDAGNSQYHWARSRSSFSEYLMRGSAGQARIERVIVDGITTLAPLAIKSELMRVQVKQIIELVSVKMGDSVPAMPTPVTHANTLMYEVWSFADTPKVSKIHPWVIYTGKGAEIRNMQTFGLEPYDDKEFEQIKKSIITSVRDASLYMTDMDQEEGPEIRGGLDTLRVASNHFKHLSKEGVLEVFEHFFENDLMQNDQLAKKLVVDVAAASGNYFAYAAILDFIQDERIEPLQIMTIFAMISNNAQCPGNIPALIDYALNLKMREKPFLSSMVLVNLAGLIRVKCTDHKSREIHYAGPLFGDYGCNKEIIKDRFVPYLKDLLYNEKSLTWEKDIAIRALGALEISFVFPILIPIIEGRVKCSSHLRVQAIHALEGHKLAFTHQHLRDQVTDLMTDVFSDIGEDPVVRVAAVQNVASWFPSATFWHRLAHTTWSEPSKNFASFVTQLIQSYASFEHPQYKKLNQAAAHALTFAKPVPPSMKYSSIVSMGTYLADLHFFKFQNLAAFSSDEGINPKEIKYYLFSELGGLGTTNLEMFLSQGSLIKLLVQKLKSMQDTESPDGVAAKIAADFYQRIQETIGAKTVPESPSDIPAEVYMRLFDNIRLYFPLTVDTLQSLGSLSTTEVAELAIQLGLGYDFVLGKFASMFELVSVYPTEVGLPLYIASSWMVSVTEPSYTTLHTGGADFTMEVLNKMQMTCEYLTNLQSNAYTTASVVLPWSQRTSGVGLKSTREGKFPLKLTINKEQQKVGGKLDIVNMEFTSLYKKDFIMLAATNMPMLVTADLLHPITGLRSKLILSPIKKAQPKIANMRLPSKYTGIDATVTWESERDFPFSWLNLANFATNEQDLFSSPLTTYAFLSPTVEFWQLWVTVHPQESTTDKLTLQFGYGVFGKSEPVIFTQETGDDFQFGQEGGFEQYDQDSYTSEQDFQEFGGTPEVETVRNVNYGDTFQQRSEKMQEHFGGTADSISLKIDFSGRKNRSFELVYASSKTKSGVGRLLQKSQLSFLRSPIPGVDENSASVCLDVQKSTPAFSKLDSVESVLESNLDKNTKLELTLGCTGDPVVSTTGTYHLTADWKAKLERAIKDGCDSESTSELLNFHRYAAYDQFTYDVEWTSECDKVQYPLTSGVLSLFERVTDLRFGRANCDATNLERKLNFNLHRCPITENWYLDASRGSAEAHVNDIPHCDAMEYWFPIGKRESGMVEEHFVDTHTSSGISSQKCYVKTDSVRTFDGFTYDFEASQCWTVAAKDCSEEEGGTLLVKAGKGESLVPDFKFIDVKKGIVVEYSNNVMRVNGKVVDPVNGQEVVKDDGGNTQVVIHKKGDYYMAQFSPEFYIAAKDTIQIHVPVNLYGRTCGLCGDYNGEPEGEFIGPHRCFYEDPKLFAAAWTAGSDTCDLYTLLELRQPAETFQKTCPKYDEFHYKCPHFNHRCYEYQLLVLKNGETESCISKDAVPQCGQDCPIYSQEKKNVKFYCWPNDTAPAHIKTALANGEKYSSSPYSAEHHSVHYEAMMVPTVCKQF